MARDKGTANVGFKFEPRTASPLDARQVVDYVSDLTDIETWKSDNGNYYYYEGMEVYVKENKKRYTLTSDNPANINNWKQGGSSGSSDDHVELTQAEYDALTEEQKMNGKVYFITDATGGGSGSGTVTTDVEAGWNLDKTSNMLSVNRQVPSITVDQDSAQVSIKAVKENGNAEELRLKTYPNDGYTGLYTGNDDDPNTTNVTAALQHRVEAGWNIVKKADGKTLEVFGTVPNFYTDADGQIATVRARPEDATTGQRITKELVVDNTPTGSTYVETKDGDKSKSKYLQEKIEAGWNLVMGADGKSLSVYDGVSYNIPDSNGYAVFVRSRPMRSDGTRGFVDLAVDQTPVGATAVTTREDNNTVTKFLQEKIAGGTGITIGADGKTVNIAQSVLTDITNLKNNPTMQAYTTNEAVVGALYGNNVYGKTISIDMSDLSWSQGSNNKQTFYTTYTLNNFTASQIIDYSAMFYYSTDWSDNYFYERWEHGAESNNIDGLYSRGLRFLMNANTRSVQVQFWHRSLPNIVGSYNRISLTIYYIH